MKCAQPGCGGTIVDGYCDVCGLAPAAGGSADSSSTAANGDRRSTNFLTYIALRAGAVPRTGQVGVRFAF